MKKMLCIVMITGLALGAIFANGTSESGAKAPTFTIKATTSHSAASESAEITFLNTFKDIMETETDGDVVVDIYPSEQLGSQPEMVQGVQGGTIEMASFNYAILNSYYPETMVVTCPGFFKNATEVNAVMNGSWGEELNKKIEEETGIKVVSALSNGFRCFTSNKPLNTVDSAKGQTFRCMQNQVSIEMVKAIGANATPMASGEMYTAMQNGTVDGQENPINNILNDKTYEVQKYMVLDNHMASICAVIVNSDFYNSLPSEYKTSFDKAIEEAKVKAIDMYARIEVQGLQDLKDYGLTIFAPNDEELLAWQTPISNACEKFVRAEVGDVAVDTFQSVIKEYRNK